MLLDMDFGLQKFSDFTTLVNKQPSPWKHKTFMIKVDFECYKSPCTLYGLQKLNNVLHTSDYTIVSLLTNILPLCIFVLGLGSSRQVVHTWGLFCNKELPNFQRNKSKNIRICIALQHPVRMCFYCVKTVSSWDKMKILFPSKLQNQLTVNIMRNVYFNTIRD